ncbi:FtsK/SpoIIIE domain-containing protein [Clostridium paridis]|uniref:FtsK domain-containing protein n=1 Tax=Clostridium paridis TaxID=2803863 RepID=A0A937FHS9_9CLOT|nr:FtsK/SpoIIIE domain-containing protein [Clostridium paridis]MBL4932283.1 hypothetical protein [Clostridium paridis]
MKKSKGVRIRQYHKSVVLKTFLFGGMALYTAFLSLFLMLRFKNLNNLQKGIETDLMGTGLSFLVVLIITIVIMGLFKFVFKKFFFNLNNKRKLCKVILNNNFFLLENIKSGSGKSKKRYIYFPRFYYSFKDEKITITIELDGSKFHSKYLDLGSVLEQMYNAELIDKVVKNSEVIYILQLISKSRRLSLDIKDERKFKAVIPLMEGLNWDIINVPHAIVTGGTGGGKTYFLFYLVRSLFNLENEVGDPLECIVKIIDPKMSDLSFLDSVLPGDVFFEEDKILKALRLAVEEMDRRYSLMRIKENQKIGSNFLEHNLNPYFIVFDEFIAFASALEKKKKEELRDRLFQIILKGRQAGIFLIPTSQRADAEFLSGAVRDNLGLRVSLGNLSSEGYKMTFGDVEKEFLPRTEKGQGYVYLMGESKVPVEFYSPLIPEDYDFIEDIKELLSRRKRSFSVERRDNDSLALALEESDIKEEV